MILRKENNVKKPTATNQELIPIHLKQSLAPTEICWHNQGHKQTAIQPWTPLDGHINNYDLGERLHLASEIMQLHSCAFGLALASLNLAL